MAETLTTGQAAKLLGMHVKTLQRLDRQGLLKPVRSATGRRVYTASQLRAFLGVKDAP